MPVSRLISDGLLAINDGYRAKNSELSSSGLPFARAGNIDGGFRFQSADRFPKANLVDVGDKVSRPGDVVFTSKGTVGRFALVGADTESFVYSPQLCFWRSMDHERLLPRWLFYWMQSDEFRQQYLAVSGQTDMAAYVNLRDQRRMYMRVPPPGTQRAIAHILGTLDDKIDLNLRMAETLESIARAIFKSWFVDFDPVRAKAEGRGTGLPKEVGDLFPDRLVESEIGDVPEAWSVVPLSTIADFENGAACQRYAATPGESSLPVIKIRELNQGVTDQSDRVAIGFPAKHLAVDGDVLFSWSGTLVCRLWAGNRAFVNQHVFRVRHAVTPRWFYYHSIRRFLDRFRGIAGDKATTMGHINRRHLDEALLAAPPGSTWDAFTRYLEPLLDRQVEALLESRCLAHLRDLLLPALVSGSVRVEPMERGEGAA